MPKYFWPFFMSKFMHFDQVHCFRRIFYTQNYKMFRMRFSTCSIHFVSFDVISYIHCICYAIFVASINKFILPILGCVSFIYSFACRSLKYTNGGVHSLKQNYLMWNHQDFRRHIFVEVIWPICRASIFEGSPFYD